MWLFAMFDLPVGTRAERRAHTAFRKFLKREGFTMLQYSVYARYCGSEDVARGVRELVGGAVPEKGQVRMLGVTEAQFGKQVVFVRGKRRRSEKKPEQLLLF